MGKMVGMAEFKANCTRLLREVRDTGEPITVTNRGKAVATVTSPPPENKPGINKLFGAMRGTVTIHGDIDEPLDPDWEAKWEAKWDDLGFPAPGNSRQ